MTNADLTALRKALLELHRVLVNHERVNYERLHGRLSPAEFLQRALKEGLLEWIAPLSHLIVQMDEHLEGKEEPPAPPEQWIAAARALMKPDTGETQFKQCYAPLLQEADVVVAHGEVMRALAGS